MLFGQTELNVEAVKEAGLAEQAEACAFETGREPGEGRKLRDSAEGNIHTRKIGGNSRAP
jgi:hypothetical protein